MKKYIVGICFSLFLFSACSDWLNVEPKTTVKEEEVFGRELGFKEALTGAYIKMAATGLYARNLSFGFLDILGGRYTQRTDQKVIIHLLPILLQRRNFIVKVYGKICITLSRT